ncbi:bactofilin family protein [Aquisalinus flavus]|uniref:Polymer-forming cytoskeletal protein n=1 Tax=Aquisalinus flavus TaxID=1526572 RepID=A0A8J2V2E0_9PROT|nr:polymer-forming cytoskeletal protein [Aquisalinus flavus]MBD0427529.1 polymer-forming cytoskeletal protein [Aquisalinus flavus]UNE47324.1 polymer-forming cytoskeletal protein [Aquisalinus flavus]GGD01684.1 hypothetical protein GCM10011342_08420 [Aquisalinus flavus]
MFSKAKQEANADSQGLVEIGDAPEAQQPQQPRKPVKQERSSRLAGNNRRNTGNAASVPSLISSDVVIRGSIEAEGEVQFDGVIEGNIGAKGLVIGEGAVVTGEVIADKVKVAGTVEGTIRANSVELAMTAIVKGDIVHTALSIESGARFEGSCRHSENPQEDEGGAQPSGLKRSQPRTVAAAEEQAHVEISAGVEEEEETIAAEAEPEETTRPPLLKSLPGSGGQRPSSPFLNRAGKPDLR